MSKATKQRIESTIRRLLRERGAGKTICPSDAARAIAPENFRQLMPRVREVAQKLVDEHEIVVMQRGRVVDLRSAKGPIRLASAAAHKAWYIEAYRGVDFRAYPELYRVGRGEAGVLVAEPYKSELLPLWKFRTRELAEASAKAIWRAFVAYRRQRDFVGMDMARKFLMMGFTRARRYANHRSGKKYAARDVGRARSVRQQLPISADPEKAAAAKVFYAAWQRAERDRTYATWRARSKRTSVREHGAHERARAQRRALQVSSSI